MGGGGAGEKQIAGQAKNMIAQQAVLHTSVKARTSLVRRGTA